MTKESEALTDSLDRATALRYAALDVQDRERLIERLEFDLQAECTRTSCLEPEVHALAAIALVLLGVTE